MNQQQAILASKRQAKKDLCCGDRIKEDDAKAQLALLALLSEKKVTVTMIDPANDNTWLWEAVK